MKSVLAGMVLILFVSSFSFAQAVCSTYSFFGTIIVAARDHPTTYEVQLLADRGEQPIAYAYVDMTNRFSFDGVTEGRYDVVVRLEHFQELRSPVNISSTMNPQANGGCNLRDIFWLLPLESIDQTSSRYPPEAMKEYELAIRAENNKDFAEAVIHLETAVRLAPDWFDAHSDLGAVYEKVNRVTDAATEYRKALALKPDSVRAQLSLGRLLLDEADKKLQDPQSHLDVQPSLHEAHELISKAILADPKSAMASFLLGGVDFRLMEYKAAEAELERALELDPKMFQARITLANLYINRMRWQDALDQVDLFILENPTSPYLPQMTATRTGIVRKLQAIPPPGTPRP
jgi:tetratricopeptide (TPR) repeat protein